MKRIVVVALVILISVSVWYLFIKKYDYQVSFNVKGSPGSVYHQVISWESWGKDPKAKNITTLDTTLFKQVSQAVIVNDTIINLDWTLESLNDSITKIRVGAISEEYSIQNRVRILMGETIFTRGLKKELKVFGKLANNFADTFKIEIEGESDIPSLAYLFVSSSSSRFGKAGMMMRTNSDLYPKILENNLKVDGAPFVRIKEWDVLDDKIKFDFGFPIKYTDSLPLNSLIKFDRSPPQKALKAVFYGNYRNSDQAWFALMAYAKRRNISIVKKPLEIFYNNPMQDGNASQWKAEIFIPISSEN
ncbi:hypothetical protein [Aquimarina latercula]|uniref:hypothetical protein n=1 Tax=Aquimarina latercula TaxID=987 RepID=UPI000403F132|nr:hypothetical protein [Aquimarina latercula]